jgi:superfamily II DNA or RNA helicase
VDVGTSGGKTLLATAIIARLGLPTLYLVTTRTLLAQTAEAMRELLGVEPGVVGAGTNRPERLTVALIQSLDDERLDLSPFSGGTLVFDEGHHAAATTYQELIRRVDPRYRFFLSAVPFRSGDDQVVLEALAGPGGRLTGGRYAAAFLIERGYACPVEVRVEVCRISGECAERSFATLYSQHIVANPARNRRIAEIAADGVRAGRSVLILVDHVRHGRLLERLIGPERAAFVHGSTPKCSLHETVEAFAEGRQPVLVATSGLFMEGVSINGIEVLVAAGGLKSRAKVIQSVGRGMRRAPGKRACVYVDFLDDDSGGPLSTHSRERLRVLKEEGFEVPDAGQEDRRWPDLPPVQPSWAHVPGSDRFVLVSGEGKVLIRARCLRSEMVPDELCERCDTGLICRSGGRILWLNERACADTH